MKTNINQLAIETLIDVIALSQKGCIYPIVGKLAYASNENFIGRVIDGYSFDAQHVCLLAKNAARALCNIQNELNSSGLGLYIFDAYRPLRAVKDFASWYTAPVMNDFELERKKIHYPNLEKNELVAKGYSPDTTSKHNFGCSVDVALIQISDNTLLEMGTCFDFFDELSHDTATPAQIGKDAYLNRQKLTSVMKHFGFLPYTGEYWHFDYQQIEVDVPLDILIEPSLKGLNTSL